MSQSHLESILAAGRFALTAEVTPPLSADPQDLLDKALPLAGLADAVNVTDGAGARAHLDALAAAVILNREGIEPILQMTCRDRNRIALQSELVGAAALGITNLLVLGGDPPSAGDQPDARAVFDLDSAGLVATAAAMRDRGTLPNGRKVGGRTPFFIGVADAPLDPPPGWQPTALARKIDAGGVFVQTQFCMDADVLRRYTQRLAEAGIADRLHLLVGLAPLPSARSARWIRDNLRGSVIPDRLVERMERASDPVSEGRAICLELLEEYAAMPGVGGAHLMAPRGPQAIPEIIQAFRARTSRSRI
jgi:methylenetetrahydrofolate reductase (NADH)